MSSVLRDFDDQTLKAERDTHDLDRPVAFLYTSRFFKSIIWWIHLCVLGGTVAVFINGSGGAEGGGIYGQTWFWVSFSAAGTLGWLIVYTTVGSFFSKAFR